MRVNVSRLVKGAGDKTGLEIIIKTNTVAFETKISGEVANL